MDGAKHDGYSHGWGISQHTEYTKETRLAVESALTLG